MNEPKQNQILQNKDQGEDSYFFIKRNYRKIEKAHRRKVLRKFKLRRNL